MSTFVKRSSEWWDTIAVEAMTNSCYEIAKREGITSSAVFSQLKKRGIRGMSHHDKKRTLNVSFFNSIDSEEKAYWLGFIMADGCVFRTNREYKASRLSFNLSAKDMDHLVKFVTVIKSPAKIKVVIPKRTYSENPIARLCINSTQICSDLEKYGVIERKTGTRIIPVLPIALERHFIRGYFDGDGSVSQSQGRVRVSFTSDKNMLLQLKERLHNAIGTSNVINPCAYKNRDAYILSFGGKFDVVKLFHYFYTDSTTYLERKHTKFKNLLLSVVA